MACCLSRETDSSKLHLITYLCPDFPLELFETYQHYLEEVLSRESHLIVESRWGAPPAGKTDPFTANEVDIGKKSLKKSLKKCLKCYLTKLTFKLYDHEFTLWCTTTVHFCCFTDDGSFRTLFLFFFMQLFLTNKLDILSMAARRSCTHMCLYHKAV